jgi:flavin-binding protein dodecin
MSGRANARRSVGTDEDWTPEMVQARLVEAADTLRRLPAVKVQGYFSTWPPIVRDFWEAFGWNDVEVRLGPPAPDAIDRMDETLQWLRWLEPDETRLVWLRAEGVRWKLISARFGIGRTTAWYRWSGALAKIAARLNAGG